MESQISDFIPLTYPHLFDNLTHCAHSFLKKICGRKHQTSSIWKLFETDVVVIKRWALTIVPDAWDSQTTVFSQPEREESKDPILYTHLSSNRLEMFVNNPFRDICDVAELHNLTGLTRRVKRVWESWKKVRGWWKGEGIVKGEGTMKMKMKVEEVALGSHSADPSLSMTLTT